MNLCPDCGVEINSCMIDDDTKCVASPVLERLMSTNRKDKFEIPFACSYCKSIKFDFEAVRDVVFLLPAKKVEKFGMIWLPDDEYVGGNPQNRFKNSLGVILSCGPGYLKNGKYHDIRGKLETGDLVMYEKNVPWRKEIKDFNGSNYEVVVCGFLDVYAKVKMDSSVLDILNVSPMGNRIMIQQMKDVDKTNSGIALARTESLDVSNGLVLAAGDSKYGLVRGDRVLYAKHSGTEVTLDGTVYQILREGDIVAKIE
jgi:chaperonin GroES